MRMLRGDKYQNEADDVIKREASKRKEWLVYAKFRHRTHPKTVTHFFGAKKRERETF